MEDNRKVVEAVFAAIDDINTTLPQERRLAKSMDTMLFRSSSGEIDSLGLVMLITALEQRIDEFFGVEVTLTDDRPIFYEDSPFYNVRVLIDHIAGLLKDKEVSVSE